MTRTDRERLIESHKNDTDSAEYDALLASRSAWVRLKNAISFLLYRIESKMTPRFVKKRQIENTIKELWK